MKTEAQLTQGKVALAISASLAGFSTSPHQKVSYLRLVF
jgi:hypothetical protein